jgi:hypothetical protein
MRLWLSGPRILGIRPGVTFRRDELFEKPKQRKSASSGSFIYVVQADNGMLKIGVSTNPSARLAQLCTASPFKLSLAWERSVATAMRLRRPPMKRLAATVLKADGSIARRRPPLRPSAPPLIGWGSRSLLVIQSSPMKLSARSPRSMRQLQRQNVFGRGFGLAQ